MEKNISPNNNEFTNSAMNTEKQVMGYQIQGNKAL